MRYLALALIVLIPALALGSDAPDAGSGGALLKNHRDSMGTPAAKARGKASIPTEEVTKRAGGEGGLSLLAAHPAIDSKSLGRIQHRLKTRGSGAGSRIYRENVDRVALIATRDGSSGSGVVVSDDGKILTNLHVVDGQSQVLVFFYEPGREDLAREDAVVGQPIAHDTAHDLALVQVADLGDDASAVELGPLDSIEVGSEVYAIGHPNGLLWTFTEGVVSQIRRDFKWGGNTRHRFQATVIQTQTPINPGNSGGPLFNEAGEVVGVNSFIQQGAEGLNFAVAVDEIEEFLSDPGTISPDPRESGRPAPYHPGESHDLNRDGRPDSHGYRPRPEGRDRIWLYDLNGDGSPDASGYDLNENGMPDTLGYDTNGDGVPDLFRHDSNEDGIFDVEGLDLNGDGRIDRIRPLV